MTTPKIAVTQGLFDIIVERAATMTSRCMLERSGSVCGYRDGRGNACFAGMVLSDEMVSEGGAPSFMGGIERLIRYRNDIHKPLPEYVTDNERFLRDMQRIHDNDENWTVTGPNKDRMHQLFSEVAADFGLNAKTVEEHFPV